MKGTRKIAIVANSTWNIYNFRLNLIREFIRQGFQVVVIAPVDEYIHYLNKIKGVHHIALQQLSRNSVNPAQDAFLMAELKNIYRRIQPDLVLHYTVKPNIWGNLAAHSLGIRSICVVTGLGYSFLNTPWLKKITQYLYRLSFSRADRIIFQNPDDHQLFSEMGIVDTHKTHTILGSGVNTDHFYFSPSVSKTGKTIFTFIGRLLRDKGINEFVQAARAIQAQRDDVECWVIGDIDEGNPSFVSKSKLLRWVEEKSIKYLGTKDDVRPFIEQSDCVVLPSYREGLSKVLIEALSMGKPIIASDTPGCRQTIDHNKNGFLVPVKDEQALEIAMTVFTDLTLSERKKMGQHSRQKSIRLFDDRVVIREYLSIIEELMNWKLKAKVRMSEKQRPI